MNKKTKWWIALGGAVVVWTLLPEFRLPRKRTRKHDQSSRWIQFPQLLSESGPWLLLT